jgi:hypothetical protein
VDNVGRNIPTSHLSPRRRLLTFADQFFDIWYAVTIFAFLFEYTRCNYFIPDAIVILKQIASYSNSISLFAELI